MTLKCSIGKLDILKRSDSGVSYDEVGRLTLEWCGNIFELPTNVCTADNAASWKF